MLRAFGAFVTTKGTIRINIFSILLSALVNSGLPVSSDLLLFTLFIFTFIFIDLTPSLFLLQIHVLILS